MEEVLALLKQYWVAIVLGIFGLFGLFKKFVEGVEWVVNKFGLETKGMREKREAKERMDRNEQAIEEIKETSKRNVALFLEHEQAVVGRFTDIRDELIEEMKKLHDKIDKQKDEMDDINKANIKTDRAMLRDRIASGMRYFSQNVGEDGKVHISLSDYENLNELFQRYFARGGNGAFKKMYEDEFRHFIIDQ